MVRVKCSNCESTKDVSYLGVAGASPAVRAEACDECRSYLKIVYRTKDPLVDPVADDMASLALDMLMDEAGYSRSGPNLFLIPGDAATA
jgi:FdhE protein